MNGLGEQVTCRQVPQESDLGLCAKASADELGDFSDDEGGNDEGSWVSLEQFEANAVVAVIAIDVGIERTGVDDQRDDCTSAARISSMRSAMSSRPLAPAPAARRRRRPGCAPRNASMACRVTSETVLPRRSASCRRRASSSSGSFTVVRCIYASTPLDRHSRRRPPNVGFARRARRERAMTTSPVSLLSHGERLERPKSNSSMSWRRHRTCVAITLALRPAQATKFGVYSCPR